MNIMNLTAKLILDDKEYTVQLQEAKQKAENVTKTTQKMSLGAKIGWAAVGTAIVGVISKMGQLMTNTMAYADNIKNLAQIYETTTENLQELNFVAQESGKNAEWVLRKARSSGQSYAEVLGLTNEEYQEMVNNAREMGLVLEDEVLTRVDDLGDQISALKYQFQAVLTGLLAGNEDADEQLSAYFQRVGEFMEDKLPIAIQFIFRLLMQMSLALVRVAPQLINQLLAELIDYALSYTLSFDWAKLGWNIMIAILEGMLNGLVKVGNKFLKYLGIKIPEANLGALQAEMTSGQMYSNYNNLTNNSNSSNVTNNNTTITIEAKGDARQIANEVSKILATKIQAKG